MTPTRAPAFQFYPKDFLSDLNVLRMDMRARGVYITLLAICWQEDGLPDDLETLAALTHLSRDEFADVWRIVGVCFRANAGLLRHPRLALERKKQRKYRNQQHAHGVKGAQQRWGSPSSPYRDPMATPIGSDSSSSSSAFAFASSSAEAGARRAAAPEARSKRPIYQSDRFVVFEWQLDDLGRMLGSHLDGFDLHAFFDALSQQSRTSGLVIPKADTWPWLQAQVVAEARRRGLPMASADPGPPQNRRIAGLVAGGAKFLRGEGS